MNQLLDAGDENGNLSMIETVVENGKWKLQYKNYGAHRISDVTGTAKQDVFYGNYYGQENTDFRIQAGAGGGQELQLNKIALSSTLLKLDHIDVTRHSHAKFALKHMDYAIRFINGKRSDYGAKQNRLEAAVQLAENMGNNLQEAESRIRDANLADEVMRQLKETVLAQAGQGIMARVNQIRQQEVSNLLGVFS